MHTRCAFPRFLVARVYCVVAFTVAVTARLRSSAHRAPHLPQFVSLVRYTFGLRWFTAAPRPHPLITVHVALRLPFCVHVWLRFADSRLRLRTFRYTFCVCYAFVHVFVDYSVLRCCHTRCTRFTQLITRLLLRLRVLYLILHAFG